jgi:phenylalanyl-tRNA synthetase beta chain
MKSGDAESAEWIVPAFRGDLTREVDLIEEVIRLVGIERVVGSVAAAPAHASSADASYDAAMDVRRALSGMGFSEARTSTLVARPAGDSHRELRNPLGEEQSALRPSLLDGLFGAVRRNVNHGASTVRLCEVGRVFANAEEEEVLMVGFVATGPRAARTWRDAEAGDIDLFDLRGIIETLAPGAEFATIEDDRFGLALEVRIGGFVAGVAGQLTPAAGRELDARKPVVAAELRMDALQAVRSAVRAFAPAPKFPGVTRDLAAVMPRSVGFGEVERVVKTAGEPLLAGLAPFDIFTDDSGVKLPADRKSLAFSLTFRSPERTLTTEEVNAACDRLRSRLRGELGIEFRE